MEKFEKAAQVKLRFASSKGELSVEDLFELSLPALDIIAKGLNKQLKEDQESFIGKPTATKHLALKLEIVVAVIDFKQEERTKARTRAEKSQQVEFMETLLEKKKLDALESMSVDDIEKQLATLKQEEE